MIRLTLSENQLADDEQTFAEMDSPRSNQVRLQGWEQFDEPVDRIVSLGAFEHFADGVGRFDRYDDFFQDVLQHSARRWRDAAAFDRGAQYRGGRAAGAEDDDDAASAKKILTCDTRSRIASERADWRPVMPDA